MGLNPKIKLAYDGLYKWAFEDGNLNTGIASTEKGQVQLASIVKELKKDLKWKDPQTGKWSGLHESDNGLIEPKNVLTAVEVQVVNDYLGTAGSVSVEKWIRESDGKDYVTKIAKAHVYHGQDLIAEAAYGGSFGGSLHDGYMLGADSQVLPPHIGQPRAYGQIGNGVDEGMYGALMMSALGAFAVLIGLCTLIVLCCAGFALGWFGAYRFPNKKRAVDVDEDPSYQQVHEQSDV